MGNTSLKFQGDVRMKIKCIILRRNRTIITKSIDGKKSFFRYNKGIYLTPKNFVNLISQVDDIPKISQYPELIFYEDDPVPLKMIQATDNEKAKKELEARSGKFLDLVVVGNALKELAKPQGLGFQILFEYIKSPSKMLPMLFIILIVLAVLSQFMQGGSIFG